MTDETDTSSDRTPLGDTVAGTGPGIPDDALAPGERLPDPPSDADVAAAAKALDAPRPGDDEAAAEAHPS